MAERDYLEESSQMENDFFGIDDFSMMEETSFEASIPDGNSIDVDNLELLIDTPNNQNSSVDSLKKDRIGIDKVDNTSSVQSKKDGEPSKKYQKAITSGAKQLIGNIGFYGKGSTRMYNDQFFETTVGKDDRIILKVNYANNNLASKAVLDIFYNPSDYNMDCAEFIQYCHIYAKLECIGSKKFDAIYNKNNPLIIGNHGTSGINTSVLYTKGKPSETWHKNGIPDPYMKSIGGVLLSSPIGTRVSVTNLDAEVGSDYRNENFIKIGDNEYIAHPIGEKLTIKEIAESMARMTYNAEKHGDNFEKYRIDNVFVSQVELYEGN